MTFSFHQLNVCKNGLTVLHLKAKLDDSSSIEEMLETGGSLSDVVYGFALGGHTDEVNKTLAEHPSLNVFAARGYARSGDSISASKLFRSNSDDVKKALLFGYAQNGNVTQINGAINSHNRSKYLPIIVEGLASGGHTKLVDQYAISTKLQNIAIAAAAKSGNEALVNHLLTKQEIDLSTISVPLSPAQQLALGNALRGYSEGRHFNHLEPFLSLGINPMLCLTAIAKGSSIDPSDAMALIDSIKGSDLKKSIKTLMQTLFKSDIDKIDFDPSKFTSTEELESLLNIAKDMPIIPGADNNL